VMQNKVCFIADDGYGTIAPMKTCVNRRMAPSDEHAKRSHLNSYLPWEGSNIIH
jgi:hypothetical protein